ncbi:hypothetical protein [Bacillus cereus]|uniref:hypothetical protein n=1 Tax=Bacillus cereus TaxID=1396 RepID=UPI0012ADD221|nr:hypothetical protein [Bacillus cereus]
MKEKETREESILNSKENLQTGTEKNPSAISLRLNWRGVLFSTTIELSFKRYYNNYMRMLQN